MIAKSLVVGAFAGVCLMATSSYAQAPFNTPEEVGLRTVVPQRLMFVDGVNNANWEPYCGASGDGTLLFSSNTTPAGDPSGEKVAIAYFPPDNTVVETDGFFSLSPTAPWATNNDIARANGNPPRVHGDRRPGQTKYIVCNEATPWAFPLLFPNYGPVGFTYTAQSASAQLFDRVANAPVPLSPVFDPAYEFATALVGNVQTAQMRFGGDAQGLSDGNFVVQVESQDTNLTGQRSLPLAIYDTAGAIVFGPTNGNQATPLADTRGWSNVAAFNGGFATRPESGALSVNGRSVIQFWSNAGAELGTWEYVPRFVFADPLAPAGGKSTSINEGTADALTIGNGGGRRIAGHPAQDFIVFAGPGVGPGDSQRGAMYVTKIDTTTRLTVGEVNITDGITILSDRVMCAMDELGNIIVHWSDRSNSGLNQSMCVLLDADLNILAGPFQPWVDSELGPGSANNFVNDRPNCAIAEGRILISQRVGADAAALGLVTNDQIATVLEIVAPPDVTNVENWNKYEK